MRISDWSSDVCSSDLAQCSSTGRRDGAAIEGQRESPIAVLCDCEAAGDLILNDIDAVILQGHRAAVAKADLDIKLIAQCRSEDRRVGKECVGTFRSRWWPYH